MASLENRKGFRVIIVGGSVSGLTLANALDRAGIDFVVLEKQNDITVQNGASIVVFPNGFAALEQLGLYEDIAKLTLPITKHNARTGPDARLFWQFDGFYLQSKRTGYPGTIFPRLSLVKLLHARLPQKNKVFTKHRVSKVEYSSDGVTVHCENGASFDGDLVVGADGIHSVVRTAMWRHADKADPSAFSIKDKTSMAAEFKIMFGISKGVEGLPISQDQHIYGKDCGVLLVHSKDNFTYWFMSIKLDKKYVTPNIPRYTKSDAVELAERYLDLKLNEHLTFATVWEKRTVFSLHPAEEYLADRWTWNRFVAIGDAVHKFAPNNGQGGNAAIEDAASLANQIKRLDDLGKDSDTAVIERHLKAFQDLRYPRNRSSDEESRIILRTDTLQGPVAFLMARYVIPNIPDFVPNKWSESTIATVLIDYLPVPKHSKMGTMPINTRLGPGRNDTLAIRLFRALPLVFIFVAYFYIGQPIVTMVQTELLAKYKAEVISNGGIRSSWLSINAPPGLDVDHPRAASLPAWEFLMLSYQAMLGNPVASNELLILWLDFSAIYGIWVIESNRRGNFLTFSQIPALFVAVLKGSGCGIVGIYAFLHYIQNSPSNFVAADQRYVHKKYAQALLPTLIIAYVVPTLFILFFAQKFQSFGDLILAWQLFPIMVPLVHYLLAQSFTETASDDRLNNPWADLPYLRLIYAVSGLIAASGYWYVNLTGPLSLLSSISLGLSRVWAKPDSMGDAWSVLLVLNILALNGSMGILVLLHFRDLKAVGRLDVGWTKLILSYGTLTIMCGSGAASVAAWAYRDEILARRPELPGGEDIWTRLESDHIPSKT